MDRPLTIPDTDSEELGFKGEHDSLTGCFSRRCLKDALQFTLTEVAKGASASLLRIDIDNFKIVNDIGGYSVGDQFLVTCANLIRGSVRNDDRVIRVGGDDFLVILKNLDYNESCKVGERVRKKVSEFTFLHSHHHFNVTISIGITQIHLDSSPDELISWSDSACHSAKRQGGNCVFKHDIIEVEREVCDWKEKIQNTILEDRFDLWFQPILEISSSKILMHEALLRPRSEDGMISNPMPYLKAAERYKIAPNIDQHNIQKAFNYLNRFPDKNLNINLSAQSLSRMEIFDYIQHIFAKEPSYPSRVCFEITETALIADITKAGELMNRLHELGFRFAIDDFGAGFSSFNYFSKFPIQYLKIDGSYIVKLEENKVNQAVVRGINLIAHELNIRTVAEHVETAATLAALAELNIDFAQGYFIGRPIPWK